jgi:hypothetical protein
MVATFIHYKMRIKNLALYEVQDQAWNIMELDEKQFAAILKKKKQEN